MKKWGLALLISLFAGTASVAAEGIMTTEQQAVYDAVTNEEIGYTMPNVYYETLYETDEQFFVQVETATAYVNKSEAVQLADQHVKPVKEQVKTVVTNEETTFYKASNLHAPMYIAEPNRRFIVTNETATYYEVRLFGQSAYVRKGDVRDDRGIPVLLYHHLLRDRENVNYKNQATLDPLVFIVHMEYLKKAGYETVTLDELYAYINGEQNLPANVFALTFDDGLATTERYAYELLKAFEFNATNFIITSRISAKTQPFNADTLQFVSLEQMNRMRDVFSFEGHTHNMHYFAMNQCGAVVCEAPKAVEADIKKSVATFPHKYFAYPFGQFTEDTIRILKEANIDMAFTTRKDYVHVGEDVYRVPRIDVQRSMTFEQFKSLFE